MSINGLSVKSLQCVYVSAVDFEDAVSFYQDVLGLNLKFQDGNLWAEFDVGGDIFAVCSADKSAIKPGLGAVTVFEVDDLDSSLLILEERGVIVDEEIVDMGKHGRWLTLRDRSGVPIQLFEKYRL